MGLQNEPGTAASLRQDSTPGAGTTRLHTAPASHSTPTDDYPLAPGLLPSDCGDLAPAEIDRLWKVVVAIAEHWGEPDDDPLLCRSQWLEFVHVRTSREPSYLAEYRSAIGVLDHLKAERGERAFEWLLFESGLKPGDPPMTALGHLKKYVVDEFIRVWLAAGGFRSYGAGNYNGYVGGSRFAVRPPYRTFTPTAAASNGDDQPASGPQR